MPRRIAFPFPPPFPPPFPQRREGFWPKASVTVAWGNAPGNRGEKLHLAEGHSQFDHARFEYGLQPTGIKLLPIPGAVPQATVKYGRWPITNSFTALPFPPLKKSPCARHGGERMMLQWATIRAWSGSSNSKRHRPGRPMKLNEKSRAKIGAPNGTQRMN